MKNATVRRAMSFAFDYANTSKNFYAGYLDAVQGCIPNGMPLETESQPSKNFTFDLKKASQLLNASGYTLDPQGKRFNGTFVEIYADVGDIERVQAASLFKTNLNRLGMNVNLTSVTGAILDTLKKTDNWDMHMSGWVIDYLDPDDYVLPIALCADLDGDYFYSGVNITAVNDAALQAQETKNPTDRANLYKIVWEGLNEDPNMIFEGQTRYVCFYRSNLQGFWFNPVTWYNFYYYSLT